MKKTLLVVVFCILCYSSTSAQFRLIKNFAVSGGSVYREFVEMNDKLYFNVFTGVIPALGISDGTTSETQFFLDATYSNFINGSGEDFSLTTYNDHLYFGSGGFSPGGDIFKSNGVNNSNSAVKLTNLSTNSGVNFPHSLVFMGQNLFYYGDDGINGMELRKVDLSTNTDSLVKDINVGSANSISAFGFYQSNLSIDYNNQILFCANDGISGEELWITDGSELGTQLLFDCNPGLANGTPRSFIKLNNKVYFIANNSQLWSTDATPIGTQFITNNLSFFTHLKVFNNEIYFEKVDNSIIKLFKLDSNDNLIELADLPQGITPYNNPNDLFYEFNNRLYFTTGDSVNGSELWSTDGTAIGTQLVYDIRTGTSGSEPKFFVGYNDVLYFSADDGIAGRELWSHNTLTNTTSIVQDLFPGNNSSNVANSSNPIPQIVYDGELILSYNDGSIGNELWAYNDSTLGNIDVLLHEEVQIYPNPVSEQFKIKSNDLKDIQSIEVFSATGQLVKKFRNKQVNYDVKNLKSGLYHLKINNQDGHITKRLIIR